MKGHRQRLPFCRGLKRWQSQVLTVRKKSCTSPRLGKTEKIEKFFRVCDMCEGPREILGGARLESLPEPRRSAPASHMPDIRAREGRAGLIVALDFLAHGKF